MDAGAFSEASALSWNTRISRTSVSSLSHARFSDSRATSAHGLEDLIRSLRNLSLRHYRLEELVREETLGQGETYMVERCVDQTGKVLAVKHLKVSSQVNDHTFRQRLQSVIFEVQIMKHAPLKVHPNILTAFGYGWNSRGKLIIPYILVEYASLGNMREHIRKQRPPLGDIEILLGDVASGLSSLHKCGIVHGDMKLDNILVFPNFDRPAKAIAKIADFGHALILNDESRKAGDDYLRYRGTSLYNAPEVQNQDTFPIDQEDLGKCDIWAFGLMIWEACIAGEEYLSHLKKNDLVKSDSNGQMCIDYTNLFKVAKQSVPGPRVGPPMFLRVALHKTIQHHASERVAGVQDIPLCTQWNARYLADLQSNMALHLESPTPIYEMFRQDNGREISWEHQQQIFQGLKQTYSNRLVKDSGPVLWQIALCYLMGFGIDQNTKSALQYAEMAKAEDHPVAKIFSGLIDSNKDLPPAGIQGVYVKHMLSLMSADSALSDGMPPPVKACFLGQSSAVMDHLSDSAILNLSTPDGCSLFHWLFIFQEQSLLNTFVKKVSGSQASHVVNLPCSLPREPHKQWPLQLIGTPLATAIAVNSPSTVRALLGLGADPFAPVYDSTQFPTEDNRSLWTAFHMAVKYHCSDILLLLVNETSSESQQRLPPLACALSFSTTLERLAMHGAGHTEQLDLTISTIQKIQSLSQVSQNGMTALMQAIDFQDRDVVSALLRADPSLAHIPLRQPRSPEVFTMPIHFASQIAARRDTPETVLIPQLIDSYADCFKTKVAPQRDSAKKTPLHLAVTGFSNRVTEWILEKGENLLDVEDIWGRTPLHYCASTANCELLLNRGANVNQCDCYGMTSLHRACYLGSVELVRCLLRWKPILDLKNNQYGPALHCGVISGSLEVVTSLLEAGAIVDSRDDQGNSALHVAARLGRYNILRLLMRYGANVNVCNYNGRNAKMIASDAGNVGILSILYSGWETSVNQRILDVDPDPRGSLYRPTAQKQTLGPDFLWDQNDLVNILPEGPSFGSDLNGATEAAEQPEDARAMEQKRENVDELFERLLGTYFASWPLTIESVAFIKRLLSVYVHGLVWRPVHATRLTEIWVRTAQDLIKMMSNPYCDICGDGRFQDKCEPHRRIKRQSDNSAKTIEPSNERISEAMNDSCRKEIDPRINQQSTESDYKNPISIAICCVSDIVASTKPRGFFPNRNVRDFEYIIRWEMDQMTCRDTQVGGEETIFQYFPEVDELPGSLTQGFIEGAASRSAGSRSTAATRRGWTTGGIQEGWTKNDFPQQYNPTREYRSPLDEERPEERKKTKLGLRFWWR